MEKFRNRLSPILPSIHWDKNGSLALSLPSSSLFFGHEQGWDLLSLLPTLSFIGHCVGMDEGGVGTFNAQIIFRRT